MLPPPNFGYVGPTSALIDNNNVLTVSWLPPVGPLYTGWEIILNGNPTATITAPVPYTGTPLFYTTTLVPGSWTMDIQTLYTGSPGVYDWEAYNSSLSIWQSVASLMPPYLVFPDAIPSADVTFSNLTLELGQPLTITLQPAYTGADQWQVLWPDGTSTGWLPLSASLLTKQFSISGPLDVVIQSRRLYNTSSYSPPVILMRQLTIQIFVVDQQYTGTATTSASLTGTLGIGGQQGFEITGATGVGSVANPWEVAARAIVRDTVTNELKLLIATTRFSNASSLLGTMGIDVFPIEGRPKNKELIQPVYENSFNALTSSVPVNIVTAQLPTSIYVGKPMAEFQMQASGGNTPYAWFTDGLPAGLRLSVNGVLSGTPLALGTNSINFAVQDSSVPFYIAEQSFPITINTDLLVEIALGQTDANGTPLAQLGTSLGVAQVDTPYSVQMQVGNINPSNPTPGGLPPYTWSIPAGNLPIGLSINSSTGLLSGTPCSYNSNSDFSKTFSAVIQVTDAVGAIATQTYTMTLEPAVLQFGNLSQPTIYAGQQFKLMVPIFGGRSPYTFNAGTQFFVPPVDSAYYGVPVLVDGQIEIDVNFPNTALGTHTFSLQITDFLGHHPSALPTQFTVTVEAALSDPFLVPAFVDHVWGYADTYKVTPFTITGDLAGFTLGGTYVSLDSVANVSSGTTKYTDTPGFCGGGNDAYSGLTFIVSGFQNAANNGTFLCVASDTTSITLNNSNGIAEGFFPLPFALTAAAPTPVVLPATGTQASPVAPFAMTTTYSGTITGGANNAYVGQSFTVIGFGDTNDGTFYCTDSTETTLILSNPNGVSEPAPMSPPTIAVQFAAKALQTSAVLSNGIVVAIDPAIPEVEFSGPSSGVYGNAQYQLPLPLQLNGNTIASFSQPLTILTHDDAASLGWVPGVDIGVINTVTRPYIVGEVIGLNPRQPFYNSSDIPAITPSPAPLDAPWVATVQSSSSLPPGLSLDANTGLIYGTLVGVFTGTSVIRYIGTSGTIHGTVTIVWNTPLSAFPPIDNIQDGVSLGTVLTGTTSPPTSYITVPAGITPISASVFYGRLPAGLTLSPTPTGQNFFITGAAAEGGYFDVWFQVVAATGIAYLHHRFSIGFIAPLTIITTSLPNVSQQPYEMTPGSQVQGFGGVPPYVWSAVFPVGASGLIISPSTGVISGTLSSFPVSSPTDFGNVAVTLTDSRSSAVTVQLDLTYNNSLRIVTGSIATVTDDPNGYSFQVVAAGGIPPYTAWAEVGLLPTGITFNSSTGVFSGVYSGATPLSYPITITVTDSTPQTTAPASFTVQTGSLSGSINDSGVGPVPRGEAYQGTLAAVCMTPPIQWQVAPTSGYPNLLLSGLSLQVNGTGTTATITGIYSGAIILPTSPYPVRVIAVDSLGDTAEAIVELSTDTNLTIIGWDYASSPYTIGTPQPFPLPNAVITGSYPPPSDGGVQLVAIHGVPFGVLANGYNQYNWSSVPAFPFDGISLSSAGVLTGSATVLFSQSFIFTAADSLTPPNQVSLTTTFASQTSALVITTASLPNATAGTPYSFQLTETGAVGSYSWSIVGGSLPSGLSMSSAGLITGTTIQVGASSITFRVTDSTSAYYNRTFTFTVVSGLTLQTGIDYTDSTSYGILGYVDMGNVVSISPRPNLSFYVVATKVVSTSPSQITVTVNAGFTATVVSLSGPSGNAVAQIQLTGPFSSGGLGSNNFTISVTDSGVTATQTFTWMVYADGALRLAANNAFPVKLTTPN